jgi:isomerase DpgB
MVTRDGDNVNGGRPAPGDATVRIDGKFPLTADLAAEVVAMCDRAEDADYDGAVVVYVSGVPGRLWARDLTVSLVSRWERVLRRLEHLPSTTIAVADGDCGGTALDALLATDYRVATASTRLVVAVDSGATWPGMALYRLVHQGANAAAIRRAVLFGVPIPALEALALHLIDEVNDDLADALAAAADMAGRFSGAELAIRRQLMFEAATVSFEDALGVHLAACDRALRRASAGTVS